MARQQALPNLTTVRLLAAGYVFCFHFVEMAHARMGLTGVNLFFVLSGFILAYNYPEVGSRRRFYAFRFARIYPLYALSLLLGLPAFVHTTLRLDPRAAWGVPLSLLMLQSWWPPLHTVLNPAAWTLPVEVFFYLCFPEMLPWVTRQARHWRGWIVAFAVLLVVPSLLVCFVLRPMLPAWSGWMDDVLSLPVFHLGEFVVGMFLGVRFLQRRPVFRGWQVLGAVLVLAAATAVAIPIPWADRVIFVNGLLTIPYGLLLYTLAGWRSRWFGHPLLQLGGEISYGIYLLQFPVYALLRVGLRGQVPPVWLLTAATVGAAYGCYVLVEKPARRVLLRWMGYHAKSKPIPTPGLTV